MNANIINWSCLAYQEFHKSIKDEIAPIVNQVGARVQNFENHFVKEAAKFVRDFKSLAKEADESLDKFTVLENENEHLLRAIVSQDIMCNVLLLLKHPISKLSLNIRKKGTKLFFVTLLTKSKVIPKVVETIALSKPVTSKSGPSTKESKVMKNNKVIVLGMFRINSLKTSRVENFVPNKPVKSSVRTKPITTSQPYVTTKKDVNFDLHGFSFTGIDNTMVTCTSKSSCIKNKEVEVEEYHRNLLLSRNQKHMSS
nr:hypothetical protein [Tanacetum cinerariifolium]